MFGPSSSRSQPKREPSSSTSAAQQQTPTTRSPLVRAARKLKNVFTRTRPNNNVNLDLIASAKNPSTPPPTTTTTSTEISEPPLRRPVSLESSPRSELAAFHSISPAGVASSDSSNLDNDVPTPQPPPTTAKPRPFRWGIIFEADLPSLSYLATSQDAQISDQIPMKNAWRLFTGEVGSWCSTESSLPTGSVTTEELVMLDTQRRARAHRYSYLKYVGWLTPEQVANRDRVRRARARRDAYSTLDGALSTKKLERRDLERRARRREYSYLKDGTLTLDEVEERDLSRRDRARLAAYLTLIGEPQ